MIKQIERLKYMDYLIRIEGTGNMKSFADKLGISRSTCGEYLRLLRDMGGEIEYCRVRSSYKYSKPTRMIIGYQNLNDSYMAKVAGGSQIKKIRYGSIVKGDYFHFPSVNWKKKI